MSREWRNGFCEQSDCNCSSRLDCYDGLIHYWSFGAAYEKAFRHWDLKAVFVIAGWWHDEIDGSIEEHQTYWSVAVEDGGYRAAVVMRIVQVWRLVKRVKLW